ncbi:hypothetical protein LTR94_032626, partial [Friedmanniomyces endolithicus]
WRRRRGRAGWSSGSAGPTTGWTSPAAPCWCPQAGSRCWNARPRARRWPPTPSTGSRCISAPWTPWPST